MDRVTKEVRSKVMSKIRGKNTSPELLVRKSLWRAGKRGYRIHKKMLGNPDIVFARKKLVIFIDGDFWHGWEIKKGRKLPPYWVEKISRNMKRDKEYTKLLKKEGWHVLRFWEHDVLGSTDKVITKIAKSLS